MADISVNGVPLSSLNWYVDRTDDVRARAQYRYATTPLWGRSGGVVIWPTVSGRSLTLAGRILTAANTAAARLTAEHTLKDWVGNAGRAILTVDEGNAPVLQIEAYLEDLTIVPIGHPLQAVASEVTMTWNAPDAVWSATSQTAIALPNTTRVALPLGSAPSTPIVRLMGSATNPTFTVRDSGGNAVVTWAVTLTLASTDYLDINCQTGVVTKYVSGTGSAGASYVTSSWLFPFAIDPAWGNYANSVWPTADVSTGQAEVLYTKRYW